MDNVVMWLLVTFGALCGLIEFAKAIAKEQMNRQSDTWSSEYNWDR